MTAAEVEGLADLYETDETAWLEAMAELAAQRRATEMDYDHLAEYLTDMARRDRREVRSRLVVLITHLLKWEYQQKERSRSWRLTIANQRLELKQMLDSKTLRRHAQDVLADAYGDSVKLAAIETGLPNSTFPAQCPYSLTQIEREPVEGEQSNGQT
jgi:hypothetical protein